MFRRALSSLLMVGMIAGLTSNPAQAAGTYNGTSGTVECSAGGTFTITNNVVTSGDTCSGDAVIPEGVEEVANFGEDNSVTSVKIPVTLMHIEPGAFAYSGLITGFTVERDNQNFEAIDGVLFLKTGPVLLSYPLAKGRTEYEVPEGVTRIEDASFLGNYQLTSLKIPASVRSIGNYALSFTILTNITFAEGSMLNTIGMNAFSFSSFLEQLDIPVNLTSIGDDAFSFAYALKSIAIPASVTRIGERAFNQAISLESVFFAPGSQLTTIENGLFAGSRSLTSIEIPASVTSIGIEAFNGATSLTKVIIPANSSLVRIKESAFEYLPSLTSIAIPASVTHIESKAFLKTSLPSNYYFLGDAPDTALDTFYSTPLGATAHVRSTAQGFGSNSTWGTLNLARDLQLANYDSNGGTSVASGVFVNGGVILDVPADPIRTGYTFAGWSATDGGSTITFPYTPGVTNDITLYAKWTSNSPAVNTAAPVVDSAAQAAAADLAARTIAAKKKYAAKTLAQQVGVPIVSSKAKVSISVAKSSKKICTKSGSKLKTLKAGTCVATFTVQEPKPKGGKKLKATKTIKTFVVK